MNLTPEQKKALDLAIKGMDKNFGKNTVIRVGDHDRPVINAISTQSVGLDIALGIGGVPEGRVIEIYGPESSGKTTLTLHLIAEAQKSGRACAFIDAEHAIDFNYASKLGVDVDNLIFSQPDCAEDALSIVETLANTGAVSLIVIDSVSALTPKAEIEGDMDEQQMGVQARLMGKALRKITPTLQKNNCTIVFINQLRQKIGGISYGCFHYDTLLNFVDGRSIPIGKVVDEKITGLVYSLNEETGEIEAKEITDWHDNGKVELNTDFIHIQTESIDGAGRFGFTCTTNHNILTDSGWKTAGTIVKEDKLVSKYKKTVSGTYKDFLMGSLVGDSHISIRDRNTGCLKIQDNANLEYARWKVSKLSAILPMNELAIKRGFRYDSPYTYEFKKLKDMIGKRSTSTFLKEHYSDMGLAILFMDDATYSSENYHNRYLLSIGRLKDEEIFKDICNSFVDILGVENKDVAFSKAGSIIFSSRATNAIAERIARYVPECMQYKLPNSYKGLYQDFTLENEESIETDFVEILELRFASKRQMRNKRKFDITVADNHNYTVGGYKNGIIVHNSNDTTSGGNALKFFASVRLDIRKISTLKNGEIMIGNRVKVKVAKNKVAPPFAVTEFDIMFGKGISKIGEIIDYGVKFDIIDKSGAWFSYGDMKLGQGRENSKDKLLEHPEIASEIEAQIRLKLVNALPVEAEEEDSEE